MFADRAEAGRRLAPLLSHLSGPGTVVLGLPRGGVPVALQVAEALAAPLDVIVVRKLGVPFQPELAMGAVGEQGVVVVNSDVVRLTHVSDAELAAAGRRERAVVEDRARRFRAGRPRVSLQGRTAVLVDDGIATGATARAACQVARAAGAAHVVLAAPVGPPGVDLAFADDADEVVVVERPAHFQAVGQAYRDFGQTSDEEVSALLHERAEEVAASTPDDAVDEDVAITVPDATLHGRLTIPAEARGVVAFAHGSGSSRHSPRNRYVASVLHAAPIGTLLFDLLTMEEERDRRLVFDVAFLADRLLGATTWLHAHPLVDQLPLGYFGASTGAAAALWAAADLGDGIAAVVSRGGRPDLAGPRLRDVTAPTLLVVGGADDVVHELNRRAQRQLRCESRLSVVPRASHLFEEPGTLSEAARLARDWFLSHFPSPA